MTPSNPVGPRHPRNTFFTRVRNESAPEGKRERPTHNVYWLQCNACVAAHTAGERAELATILNGNARTMDRHIKNCAFTDTSKMVWKSTAPTKSSTPPVENFSSAFKLEETPSHHYDQSGAECSYVDRTRTRMRKQFFTRVRNENAEKGKEENPRPNVYWMQCNSCMGAHREGRRSGPADILRGDCRTLDRHMQNCPFTDSSLMTWESTAPTKASIGDKRKPPMQDTPASVAVDGQSSRSVKRNAFFTRVRNENAEEGKKDNPIPNVYWMQCNNCMEAFKSGDKSQPPAIFNGNSRTLDRHIQNCPFTDSSLMTWKSTAPKKRPCVKKESILPAVLPCSSSRPRNLFFARVRNDNAEIGKRENPMPGVYWLQCINCMAAYSNGKKPIAAEILKGQSDAMDLHLQNCPYTDSKLVAWASVVPKESSFTILGHPNRPEQSHENDTLTHPTLDSKPTKEEKDQFIIDCADIIAENETRASFIESYSFKKMVRHLRPGMILHGSMPSKRQIANDIDSRTELKDRIDKKSVIDYVEQHNGVLPGLHVNGYTNTSGDHNDRFFVYAGNASIFVGMYPSCSGFNGIAIAILMEGHMEYTSSLLGGVTIGSFCTGDFGQNGSARRILAYRWPMVQFSSCMTLQINLMMKDMLIKMPLFKSSATEAFLAAKFLVTSKSVWGIRLRNVMKKVYGLKMHFLRVYWTCWASSQMCLASLLRVKEACEIFFQLYHDRRDFPSVLECFGSPDFWDGIQRCHDVVLPLVRASIAIDSNGVTISDVTYIFFAIFHALQGNRAAQKHVETRWRQLETPKFVLAFCLDPKYIRVVKPFLMKQNEAKSLFCADLLSKAAGGYHSMLFLQSQEGVLVKEQCAMYFNAIVRGLFDDILEDIEKQCFAEYWSNRTDNYSNLGVFANRLLSSVVLCASPEQAFKNLGERHVSSRHKRHITPNSVALVKCQQLVARLKRNADEKERIWSNTSLYPQKKKIVDGIELPRAVKTNSSTDAEQNKVELPDAQGDSLEVEDEEEGELVDVNHDLEDELERVFEENSINDKSHIDFWVEEIMALVDPDAEEGGEFFATQNTCESKSAGYAGAKNSDDSNIKIPKGEGDTYLQNMARKTTHPNISPWMIDMGFLKDWVDMRSTALSDALDTEINIPQENVHILKNYRSRKLKLADMFGAKIPSSLNNALNSPKMARKKIYPSRYSV